MRRHQRAILIVEAIVASFLMLFAFAASSALYEASLKWESQSGNARRAAMLADKVMEKLRAESAVVPPGQSFETVLAGLVGPQPDDPDAPGFAIDVSLLTNTHKQVESSGLTPTNGVHSPCSSFFTAVPAIADNLPDGNPQLNNRYNTYPYSRNVSRSLQLVQVTIRWGESQVYRMVSLIGDPITPFAPAMTVQVARVAGPSSLNNFTTSAEFEAQVVTSSGSHPQDITVLWGLSLDSGGSLVFLPLDSSGRRVRVTRRTLTAIGTGTQARVQALVRYGGQEAIGLSDPISLP